MRQHRSRQHRSRPHRSRPRPAARWLVGLLVAVGGAATVLVVAPSASAHNVLRSSSPADAAEVDVPPDSVSLVFDEPAIALGNVIEVTGPDGSLVSEGAHQLTNTTARQPISAVEAGEYEVVWRVTSSDGHPIEGSFGFTVATAADPTVVSSAGAPPSVDASSRPALPWLLGAGTLLVVGIGTWFLLRGTDRGGSELSP